MPSESGGHVCSLQLERDPEPEALRPLELAFGSGLQEGCFQLFRGVFGELPQWFSSTSEVGNQKAEDEDRSQKSRSQEERRANSDFSHFRPLTRARKVPNRWSDSLSYEL